MDAGPCKSKNDEIFSAMGSGGARPTATGRTCGVEGSPTRSTIAVSDVSYLATKMHPSQISKTYFNTSPTTSPATNASCFESTGTTKAATTAVRGGGFGHGDPVEQFQEKATDQPTAKDLYDVDEKRRGAFLVGATRNETMVQVTTTTTIDTTAVTAAVTTAVTTAAAKPYHFQPPLTTTTNPCVQSIEQDETEHGNTIENTEKRVSGRAPGHVGPAPNRCASIEKGTRQHSCGTH